MQNLVLPSLLVTNTIGEAQGLSHGSINPLTCSLSTSRSAISRWASGRRLGGCLQGWLSPVSMVCSTNVVCPSSSFDHTNRSLLHNNLWTTSRCVLVISFGKSSSKGVRQSSNITPFSVKFSSSIPEVSSAATSETFFNRPTVVPCGTNVVSSPIFIRFMGTNFLDGSTNVELTSTPVSSTNAVAG